MERLLHTWHSLAANQRAPRLLFGSETAALAPSAGRARAARSSWPLALARRSSFFLGTIARLCANYSAGSRLEKQLLKNFAVCVKLHDDDARGHADRVAYNACLIGKKLGLAKAELETLYWGALLHDLGKIAISDSILFKPGPLSSAEYTEVKRHPSLGADLIASSMESFLDIATVVRFHHERWDGGGYPVGLCSEDIPLMSRVVAIADVFEALTSERPYRRPLDAASAAVYIENQAALHFDPQLVVIFKTLFEKGALRVAPRSSGRWRFETAVLGNGVASRS